MSNKLNIYACSGLEQQHRQDGGSFSQFSNELQAELEVNDNNPIFTTDTDGNGLWAGTDSSQSQEQEDPGFSTEDQENGLWAGTDSGQSQEQEDTGFSTENPEDGLWAGMNNQFRAEEAPDFNVVDPGDGLWAGTANQAQKETDPDFEIVDNNDNGLWAGTENQDKKEDDPGFGIVDTGNGLWAGMNNNKSKYEKPEFYLTNQELWVATQVKDDLDMSGWQTNETLRYYLGSSADGGCAEYFLYIFIPDNEVLQYTAAVNRKRPLQLKTYKYVLALFTELGYGTEAEMRNILRAGIEKTFDAPVETVLEEIRLGKREGVGIAAEVVAAIISAVVTVVLAVISGVISYCINKNAVKYTAPTYEELSSSVPEDTDILGYSRKGSNGWLWLAAGVGAVLFFLGKKK